MKKTLGALAVLLVVAAYFGSPFWAVRQMRSAAKAHDGDRLAQYVDFPAVRESLKSQLTAGIAKRGDSEPSGNPLKTLGEALAVGVASTLVEALVTRESMVRLMADARPPSPRREPDETGPPRERRRKVDTTASYDGLDRVRVAITEEGSDRRPVIAVLSRQGLVSWKLTAIRLPDD